MDYSVVLFLIGIVLSGGVIGVLADNLGRKLGKKRLTFWNLRPKRTAQLGTFLAGMLTSIITIALVFALSSDVRQWIIEGRQAIRETSRLQIQNGGLKKEIDSQTRQVDNLKTAQADAAKNLAAFRVRLTATQQKEADTEKRRKRVAGQLALETTRLGKLNQALALNRRQLTMRKADLAVTQKQLVTSRASVKSLQTSSAAQFNLMRDLNQREHDLQNQISKLELQSTQLTDQIAANKAELVRLTADLESARAEVVTQNDELVRVRQLVSDEQTRAQEFATVAGAARTQPLIFPIGEEVARIQLPNNLGTSTARTGLETLFSRASQQALSRGAASLSTNGPAAGLVARTENGTRILPQVEADAIVQGMIGRPQHVVLIAYALLNSFRGEFVALDVKGFSDPVVFTSGATVATMPLPKAATVEDLLNRFTTFIKSDLLKAALAKGMIPIEGQPGSVVDVSPGSTFEILDRLRHRGRSTQLLAVAKVDIRAADTLQLSFVLK